MKRYFGLVLVTFIISLTLGRIICYAASENDSHDSAIIVSSETRLFDQSFFTVVNLIGPNVEVGRIIVKQFDYENNIMGIDSYAPSTEIILKFRYTDDLYSAAITWSKENGELLCEPVTLKFDRIYASDWQALATATHRMDLLYGGKVLIEDGSSEYSSGRLIVKAEENLPDISDFNVAMIIVDDENHYFLQFEKSSDAKKCAEYLKLQPGIEYVDIDSVVTVSQ